MSDGPQCRCPASCGTVAGFGILMWYDVGVNSMDTIGVTTASARMVAVLDRQVPLMGMHVAFRRLHVRGSQRGEDRCRHEGAGEPFEHVHWRIVAENRGPAKDAFRNGHLA